MSDWIETMNDWQSDTPTPEELFFGSVCAWIYLYYGHRKMFGVDSDIVPTINIVFVHMTGATFYIINHYLREARPYMMLLIMYTVLFYLLYYVLLILPVWNEKRISTSKVVWLVIFGLIYAVIFILFEQVAASLMYGTLCRNPKWDPFLPEVMIVLIATICWYIIVLCHYPSLIAQIFCRKKAKAPLASQEGTNPFPDEANNGNKKHSYSL
eukprot:39910_1